MTIATATKKAHGSRKYITLEDGTDFRKIAESMTKAGFKMNHATARNQLMLAMEKLFSDIGKQLNVKLNKAQIGEMLHSQEVHNALADILYMAVNDSPREDGKASGQGGRARKAPTSPTTAPRADEEEKEKNLP